MPIHIGAKVPIEQEFEILEAIRTDLLRAKARLGILYGDPDAIPHSEVDYAVGGIDQSIEQVEELRKPVEQELLRKADRALGELPSLLREFFPGIFGDLAIEDAGDYIRIRPKKGGD